MLLNAFRHAKKPTQQGIQRVFYYVYPSIPLRLPINTPTFTHQYPYCWRTTGKTPIIELGEFRKRIGVLDTEYTRTDNLKMRVIELALKQINDHTDITATYEQHKKGRVITGFSFKFKQKKPKQAEIATETPKIATNRYIQKWLGLFKLWL